MEDLVRSSVFDDLSNKVVNRVTYDNSAVLELNKRERIERQGSGKYKGNLVHAARIHMGDIERLHNMGYKLLSPDQDEVRRALLYVQQNEPHLLTVDGNPFAKKRIQWV
jgi:hypothetical protein